MKTSKSSLYACVAAVVMVAAASPALFSQTTSSTATPGSSPSTKWSVQVERVQPGEINLSYSFQAAIYESVLEELNKTQRFSNVYREGDRKAGDAANLLVLKTTVLKYTPGSETRRAVTTFSGATKISVQTQLVTHEGKILFDHKVDGNVRFFGTNLRATHNLARNIVKEIKQSQWPGPEPDSATRNPQTKDVLQGGLE